MNLKVIAIFLISCFFQLNLKAEDLLKNVDNIVSKVLKNITNEVSETRLDVYEKFARKTINELNFGTASKEEVTFLVDSISKFIILIDAQNNKMSNIDELTFETVTILENERKRISTFSLKDCYQIWFKNKQITKKNVDFIQSAIKKFFEEHAIVILDLKVNYITYKAFKETEIKNQKNDLKSKTKTTVLEHIQNSINQQILPFEQKYDSLFYFGKDLSLLDEKNTSNLILSYLQDIFPEKQKIIFVGDLSDISFAINRALNGCLENITFEKISKNAMRICLQIYLKLLLKEFKDKNEFTPAHYGKEIDLELIKKSILVKIDMDSDNTKKISKEEIKLLGVEYIEQCQSWDYFNQFLYTWHSTLINKVKFTCEEEASFNVNFFAEWKKEFQPNINKNVNKLNAPKNSYQVFSDYIEEIFLFDKEFFMINIQDDIQSIQKNASNKTVENKYLLEYTKQPSVQKKYELFKQNIKKWSQEYYVDLLSPQEIKDIPIRKQFRILLNFLLMENDLNNEKKGTVYPTIDIKVWSLFNSSVQNLYNLKLITGAEIDNTKIKEKKLTVLEYSIFDYFKKALVKNPVFNYFEFDNRDMSKIQNEYQLYLENLIPVNENEARKLVIKLLLEENQKKKSK